MTVIPVSARLTLSEQYKSQVPIKHEHFTKSQLHACYFESHWVVGGMEDTGRSKALRGVGFRDGGYTSPTQSPGK